MARRIELPTARPGVTLRQYILEDAEAIFGLIDASREHLIQFEDDTYPTLAAVIESIERPIDPTRFRFGIWDNDRLVGSISLAPLGNEYALIAFWIGRECCLQGYATLAINTITAHAFDALRINILRADTHKDNIASKAALIKCGFALNEERRMRTLFLLKNPNEN